MEIYIKVGLTDQPEVMMAGMIKPGVTQQLAMFYPDGQPVLLNVQATPIASPPKPPLGYRLRDGRGIAFIAVAVDGRTWFPMSHRPSTRPLWAIVADISSHGVMHPDHGVNCVCMDQYAREIKQHVARGLPPVYEEGEAMYRSPSWAGRFDAERRVAHVMRMVVDSL